MCVTLADGSSKPEFLTRENIWRHVRIQKRISDGEGEFTSEKKKNNNNCRHSYNQSNLFSSTTRPDYKRGKYRTKIKRCIIGYNDGGGG